MVDQVVKELAPEDITDRQLSAIEERHQLVELLVPEVREPSDGLLTTIAWEIDGRSRM